MSDGDALFRAILDAPDDDAPRLIYADWLDEHGQPDRAEFIRVQCELAKHPPGCCPFMRNADPTCPCPYCALRRRERELWDVATRFAIDTTAIWPIQVRRGFVRSLTCTAADWLAQADAITAAHPVREVRLTTVPVVVSGGGRNCGLSRLDGREKWHSNETLLFETMAKQLCEMEWPVITFHLPEAQRGGISYPTRGMMQVNDGEPIPIFNVRPR